MANSRKYRQHMNRNYQNRKRMQTIFNFEESLNRRRSRKKSISLKEDKKIIKSGDLNEIKIALNISGERMQINESLLNKYPDTLLGSKESRLPFYDSKRDEYFYDRSSNAFEGILFFYQSNGRVVVPSFVHVEIFYEELKYFRLVNYLIDDPKCDESILYMAFIDLQDKIDEMQDKNEKSRLKIELKKKFHRIKSLLNNEEDDDEKDYPKNKLQRLLFLLLERPHRSLLGKSIMLFFLSAVIISIFLMCMETVVFSDTKSPYTNTQELTTGSKNADEDRKNFFLISETVCNVIFTIEIILRLLATPDKLNFIKKFSNAIDLIAIFPFWLTFLMKTWSLLDSESNTMNNLHPSTKNLYIIKILRLTRVLRILKLSRHIRALNIMGQILYECVYEITLLITFLGINIIIFSSLIYYIELNALGASSPFISIPHAFWWAVISFTTVGYGDLIPVSSVGKFFGSIFIVCGILIALLPTPILSCKFERIYKKSSQIQSKNKSKKSLAT